MQLWPFIVFHCLSGCFMFLRVSSVVGGSNKGFSFQRHSRLEHVTWNLMHINFCSPGVCFCRERSHALTQLWVLRSTRKQLRLGHVGTSKTVNINWAFGGRSSRSYKCVTALLLAGVLVWVVEVSPPHTVYKSKSATSVLFFGHSLVLNAFKTFLLLVCYLLK